MHFHNYDVDAFAVVNCPEMWPPCPARRESKTRFGKRFAVFGNCLAVSTTVNMLSF